MKKPKRLSTKLQKQEIEKSKAESETYRRDMNTRFLFWTVCSDAQCKRAKRCEGDGEACFQRWWPHVPEDFKQEFRLAIQALHRGLTPEQAWDEARRKIAEWNAIDARRAAREAEEQTARTVEAAPPNAPKDAPVNAPVNPSMSGPRIRSL